jgi:hypothetical protein
MSVVYRFGDCLERTEVVSTSFAIQGWIINTFDTPKRLDKKNPILFWDNQPLVYPT